MKEAIATAVGLLTSLLLETVPYVRQRWANNRFKVPTLLALHSGSALAIWLLHCRFGISFDFYVPCGYQGLAEAGWVGFVAFGSSQVAYHAIMKRTPQVRRRKAADAWATLYTDEVGQ